MQSQGKPDRPARWPRVERCINLMAAGTAVPCFLRQAEQMHLQRAIQPVALRRLCCEG